MAKMLTMQKELTYKVVEKEILRRIKDGVYAPGRQLPTERELEGELKVSRLTIAKGLSNLVTNGFITRTPGRGTFVCERAEDSDKRKIKGSIKVLCPLAPKEPAMVTRGIQEGVHDAVIACGSRVNIEFYTSLEQQLELLSSYSDFGNDGFVVWPTNDAKMIPLLRKMQEAGFPFVLVDAFLPECNCDYIISDNCQGARSMIKHMVECGHRKICYFTIPLSRVSLSERLSGVITGFSENGLAMNSHTINVIDSDVTVNPGYRVAQDTVTLQTRLRELLDSPAAPTAIFASNDFMAMAIYNVLEAMGVRVPEDISLAGFDNIDASQYFKTPLTTVAQNFYEIGRMAGKVVLARRNGFTEAEMLFQNRVATELIVRDSVRNLNKLQTATY